ncbi:transmembrane protein [Ceratobasidium sp. AG-Ba]|nr:transmembrane protein [Ceratobasidium sp. AG-Ba]
MSHITRGDSPDSSTESLQHSPHHFPPQILSPGPAKTGDKDQKPLSTGVESPYWDPYAGHSASREHHEAADSIPLVAFQPHYSQFVESTNSPQVQTPQSWRGRFEPVPIAPLLLHALLCFGAFPLVFLVSRAASGMSLFWTRLIVGGLCGGVGLTLGVSLIDLSRRSMEAALWAIIIHESMKGEIQEDLDYHTANPLSPWAAILLLYKQFLGKVSTNNKKAIRKVHKDGTPWWLCIVLFLITATMAACLVFVLGRVVDIYTVQETQTAEYYETTVVGDVTPEEIARAASQLDDTFSQVKYTWTITPLSSSAHIPTDRYFAFNRTANVNGTATIITDTIHFAETFPDQLAPPNQHPAGFGTFLNQSEVGGMSAADIEDSSARKLGAGPTTRAVGQIVRWPRWGSRIKCQLIEDLGRYLTPHSPIVNMTYLYVPWTAVNSIFDTMGLPAPNATAFPPVNFTSFMEGNNTPQVTVTEQEIAMTFKWWDNGVSHSFAYQPVSRGDDGNGWLTVEVVMVRLNQSYTAPNSSFQVYGELGSAANRTQIGFDAAICVEEVKGYVLDAYNNSAGSPVSLNLQYAGTQLNNSAVLLTQDSSKPDHPRKLVGDPVPGNVQHGISSAGKWAVYNASHYNARNIMLKDNGRDWWFVPNPTVVAFGGGMAPTEYTKLNPANIARVLSNSDSQHLLPYLVGTQPVIAYEFRDNTVAYTQIYAQWLAVTLAVVLIAGIIVSVFVPRLPLGVSRKDIGVTSWLAAIEDDPSAKAHLSPIAGERFERLRRRVTRWGNTRR